MSNLVDISSLLFPTDPKIKKLAMILVSLAVFHKLFFNQIKPLRDAFH